MTVTINGSGTITGVSTMGTTVVNQTLTTPTITSTMGVGNATPSSSGAGISFPATKSPSTDANTLDDYEEGTWTPVIKGGTTAGTNSLSVVGATYTKIGRMVMIEVYLSNINLSGYTGALQLFGIPFANTGSYFSMAVSFHSGFGSVPANNLKLHVNQGASTGDFCYTSSGGTSQGLTNADVVSISNGNLIFTGTYIAA